MELDPEIIQYLAIKGQAYDHFAAREVNMGIPNEMLSIRHLCNLAIEQRNGICFTTGRLIRHYRTLVLITKVDLLSSAGDLTIKGVEYLDGGLFGMCSINGRDIKSLCIRGVREGIIASAQEFFESMKAADNQAGPKA